MEGKTKSILIATCEMCHRKVFMNENYVVLESASIFIHLDCFADRVGNIMAETLWTKVMPNER